MKVGLKKAEYPTNMETLTSHLEKWVAHCKDVTHHRQGEAISKAAKTTEKIRLAIASLI
jgi:hypothetical protein